MLRMKKEYAVFNYTDGVLATDEVFKDKRSANEFIKGFKERFKARGYFNSNMRFIDASLIRLEVIRFEELGEAIMRRR